MTEKSSKQTPKPNRYLKVHRDVVHQTSQVSPAIMLGSSFAVAMGLFTWLGMKFDAKNGTEPWGVLVGLSFGLCYGAYEVWKLVRKSSEKDES